MKRKDLLKRAAAGVAAAVLPTKPADPPAEKSALGCERCGSGGWVKFIKGVVIHPPEFERLPGEAERFRRTKEEWHEEVVMRICGSCHGSI